MIKVKELIKLYEGVFKIPYNKEILYNVLMEDYSDMVVNNIICETLHPENSIAKLFYHLKLFAEDEHIRIINEYNKMCIDNNVYTSKNINV